MKLKTLFHPLILFAFIIIFSCNQEPSFDTIVRSPSGSIIIDFLLIDDGVPSCAVRKDESIIIDTSAMGFEFQNSDPMTSHFKIVKVDHETVDETWDMPWGEELSVRNHNNGMKVFLQEKEGEKRKLNIHFKAYDDGIGFRYEFPEQEYLDSLIIMDENTTFQLTGDHDVWWIPGDWDIYEHTYNATKFTAIDALSKRDHPNLAQTNIPENAVNTPVTMRMDDGTHLSFHEANLTDYSGMTLKVNADDLSMTSELVGSDRLGYKVKRAIPFTTPWRTVQITNSAAKLIDSRLILNLNEPNILGDVSWFEPMKYVGIWWEMHVNKSSWDMASGKHGATTENAKRYIDFAAANGIKGVLVEGWNTGWERWIGFEDREGVFDFITPYPDYDLQEVVRYAKDKEVEIIMHHETSAAPRTYEQQLDTAYALMKGLGIHSVKTGYVGKIIPNGEYHHGQWMVNHYRKVLQKGAEFQVAINAHEPIKDTGLRRTYPNAISREGLRGQEFNAWATDGGNPTDHIATVAFTRMLSGPIDFTPGVFDIMLDSKIDNQGNRINTTLAHQLALYVVIYSPIQMACDLPENYEGHPAFQFIRDVGVDWQRSVTLNGEVGDFVTIARKERNSEHWYLGAITDENERTIDIDFNFLDEGITYNAIIYQDGEDAHWENNPGSYKITNMVLDKGDSHTFSLAAGGGLAISLAPQN